MITSAKKSNVSAILSVSLALSAFGIWSLADYVNRNLANLPVKRVPGKQGAQKTFDVKSLFPVWVASASKNHAASGDESVDDVFKNQKQEQELAEKIPSEPDYASLLGARMKLDSVAGNGAFINGKFYHIGEKIADFEYPSQGKQILPQLLEVKLQSVIVAHGKHKTEIKL